MDEREELVQQSYIFSPEDELIVTSTKELLWKTVRYELSTAKQVEVISRALQVFEVMPAVFPDFDIQIQITGPRRMIGSHEIFHWWHIEIENECVSVTSGGHFYRPSTGGDTFTSMLWRAAPGYATEYYDFLESLTIVDDAKPFNLEVQSIDFSQGDYTIEVVEDGEEIPGCGEIEEYEADDSDANDGDMDEELFQETVRKFESMGVECVWENQQLTSLYSVDFNGIFASDSLFKLFENIPAIRTIDVRNTGISDRTLVFIKHLESLEWLCLRGTNVSDEGLKNLQSFSELRHLDLVGTPIIGPGLSYLRNLQKLRELYVSGFQHRDKWLEMLRHELPQCSINLF